MLSFIADRIPRDRFRDISRYFHFCNNSTLERRGQQGYDRLGKVRPVLNAIKASIMDNYQPSRDIVVDEAMIPFQGQSFHKQYLPNKPVKRGIKVWCLADSTNGYVQNYDVYTGKGSNSSEGTLGSRLVLMLSDHLKHKNHHIYCDNFFYITKSFQGAGRIAKALKVCGKGKKAGAKLGLVNRGDAIARQQGPLVATSWLDKVVAVLSTNVQPDVMDTTKRTQKDGTRLGVNAQWQSQHTVKTWAMLTAMINYAKITMFEQKEGNTTNTTSFGFCSK